VVSRRLKSGLTIRSPPTRTEKLVRVATEIATGRVTRPMLRFPRAKRSQSAYADFASLAAPTLLLAETLRERERFANSRQQFLTEQYCLPSLLFDHLSEQISPTS
jgi:hypothetical protein